MKRLFLLIAIILSSHVNAQVTRATLQASGLTCSMCSNSIYKSLKTLSFIDKVEPNIKTSTFEITFKPGNSVNFNKLKDKVEDAGYAVAKFVATINFSNVQVKTKETVKIGGIPLQFINVKEQSLNGEKQVRIMNKGFVTSKEYKKSSFTIPIEPGVYFATI